MKSKVFLVKTDLTDSPEIISKKFLQLITVSNVAAKIRKDDFTAIKLHFGDDGNTGHINPLWVKTAIKALSNITSNTFLSDSNVIYKASKRSNSVDHLKIVNTHGFGMENMGVPVIIADGLRGRNFVEIPVKGKHFSKVKIASDFADCDSMLALTHVTGHILTGIGGAIKNLGMGCASRRGKYEQHCNANPEINRKHCVGCGLCIPICPAEALSLDNKKIKLDIKKCVGCGECAVICKTKAIEIRWSEKLENLQQKMVEYASGVINVLKSNIGYLNFLIKITKDCDCLAKDDPRIVDDIGILASMDPVAIDKASIDLIIKKAGRDVFSKGYPETNWSSQLNYAKKMGLGNLEYELEIL